MGGRQFKTPRRTFLASALAPLLRAQKSEVSSFDLSLLDGLATPNDLFFISSHFPAPTASAAGWKLRVSGAVAAPLDLASEDLTAAPGKSLHATIECAENPAGGGLISHAEWAGVGLGDVLERAKASGEATCVRLLGTDGFARIVPIAKARHADTLLAVTMNGEKLSPNHGFPVRAVIPGWYGMDSVKWLHKIEVLTGEPPSQPYYREVRALLGGSRRAEAITAMNVKSAFSRPVDGAILFGRRFILRGAAWAGENRVRSVAVSIDGAHSWQPARIDGQSKPYSWVGWSYEWKVAGPGSYELAVTAADDKGRQQPVDRASNRVDDYEHNERQMIRVAVS